MVDRKNGRPDLYEEVVEIKEIVKAVHQVLLGLPGTEERGLCGEVKELSASHYALKKTVYIVIAFLIGSGVITGSMVSFLNRN